MLRPPAVCLSKNATFLCVEAFFWGHFILTHPPYSVHYPFFIRLHLTNLICFKKRLDTNTREDPLIVSYYTHKYPLIVPCFEVSPRKIFSPFFLGPCGLFPERQCFVSLFPSEPFFYFSSDVVQLG